MVSSSRPLRGRKRITSLPSDGITTHSRPRKKTRDPTSYLDFSARGIRRFASVNKVVLRRHYNTRCNGSAPTSPRHFSKSHYEVFERGSYPRGRNYPPLDPVSFPSGSLCSIP